MKEQKWMCVFREVLSTCKRIKVIFDSQLSETWITIIVNCSKERKDHFELDNFNE